MTLVPFLIVLAGAPSWRDEILSDDSQVRTPALAHLHARGRAGLYQVQSLVESSADPAVRARALRALGELGDADAEWELRLQLKQASPQVAAAAVHAVVQLRLSGLCRPLSERVAECEADLCQELGSAAALCPAIADSARAALQGPTRRQLAGLRVLHAAGLAPPEAAARALMASPDFSLRLAAAEALSTTDPDAAAAAMASAVSSPQSSEAIAALGRLGSPRAAELLQGLLERPETQPAAVVALAHSAAGGRLLLERRAVDPRLAPSIDAGLEAQPHTHELLTALLSDTEDSVADAAAILLGRTRAGILSLGACLQRLGADAPHCAVGLAANPAANGEVEHGLQSLEPKTRALMVAALGSAPTPPSHAALLRLATDPSPEVRAALAVPAGKLGGQGSDVLTILVHDSQPEVRSAAAAQLVPQLSVEQLQGLASEAISDAALRPAVLTAIDRLPLRDVIRVLRAILQDPSKPERKEAMLALSKLHDPEAMQALMDGAERETDPALRDLAYSMLANQ